MTYALLKSSGSGVWSWRLAIERWPTSWVSHASMVNLAASPPRRPGLKVSGGKLKCISNIVSGELDVSGFQCTVTDLDGRPTYDLARTPPAKTQITADVTSSATSLAVTSTAGFASSGTIWLDSEAIHYGSTDATNFLSLTRGAYGSLAQAHYIGAGGMLRYPEVTDLPVTMARCRARLYVYGQNDDPTGSGTLLWTGVVSRHPSRKGGAWNISVDPITSVLARALSADLAEPVVPRGIYYPWNRPFQMQLLLAAAGQAVPGGTPSSSPTIVFPRSASDTAFFEDNEAFVIYLNTKIAAATAGWDTVVTAEADGDNGWHLKATTDGTPTAVWFLGPGGIDPNIGPARDEAGAIVTTFAASTTYRFYSDPSSLPGAGSVPRGAYGDIIPGPGLGNPALAATFPHRRIYLGGAASISSLTTGAAIAWEAFGAFPSVDEVTEVIASDTANRWVELSRVSMPSTTNYTHGWTAGCAPEIRLGRTYTSGGSIWTAIEAMIAAAPDELNAGSVPDVRADDFSTAAWEELDATWQPRIVRARRFVSFADVTIGDLAKEELKLAGYSLALDVEGRMAPFRLRRPVATEAGAVAMSFVNEVPTWSPGDLGMVNQVLLRRGYDPIEDDYTSSTDIVRDVAAFGQSPQPRTLKIEPKSRPTGEIESHAEIVETSARLFSVLAYPYAIVAGQVSMRHLDTLVGSVVAITSPHLPDPSAGTMGVEDLPGLLIGREIDLSKAVINVTIYVPLQRSSGYAPSARTKTHTDLGGNVWQLVVEAYTFPSGTTSADWFVVGDEVRVVRWDSTTPDELAGTVTVSVAGTVTVAFAGTFTPGSDLWSLGYRASTAVDVGQLAYVFMAASTGRIDAASDLDAWGFA